MVYPRRLAIRQIKATRTRRNSGLVDCNQSRGERQQGGGSPRTNPTLGSWCFARCNLQQLATRLLQAVAVTGDNSLSCENTPTTYFLLLNYDMIHVCMYVSMYDLKKTDLIYS